MPTIERPLENIHAEIYAPTGGFILGVSVFGDSFGGEALRFGTIRMGDLFSDAYESNQWVDYIADATSINYNRGAVNDGASNTVQVYALDIMTSYFFLASYRKYQDATLDAVLPTRNTLQYK